MESSGDADEKSPRMKTETGEIFAEKAND